MTPQLRESVPTFYAGADAEQKINGVLEFLRQEADQLEYLLTHINGENLNNNSFALDVSGAATIMCGLNGIRISSAGVQKTSDGGKNWEDVSSGGTSGKSISKKTIDEINGRITTNTTAIAQNAQAITLKANQTTVDELGDELEDAEASIEVNSGAITALASRVTTAEGTITSHTSSIQQNATSISTLVTKTETLEETSVASVAVYYAQNNSSTTAPTTGWATSAPAWQSGMYVWQKTLTTYADGTQSWSNPTCIQGAKGEAGTSVRILGKYDTYAQLIAAHPTGSAGDGYMVGSDLYVWSTESSSWTDVGRIRGDDGTGWAKAEVLYYGSNSATVPSAPAQADLPITSTTKQYGVWIRTEPTWTTTYKYLYSCWQYQKTDNTWTVSDPVYEEAKCSANQSAADVAANLASNYSTTAQMNAAITQSAESITSTVAATYETKLNSAANLQTAKDYADDAADDAESAAKGYTDTTLTSYSTTAQMNTAISQSATNITSTVAATYETQASATTKLQTAKDYADDAADAAQTAAEATAAEDATTKANAAESAAKDYTDDSLESYSTTTQMNSAINQSAEEITATVSVTYETKGDATAKLNTAKTYAEGQASTAQTTAISTAAADATTKASAAQQAAQDYATTNCYTRQSKISIASDKITIASGGAVEIEAGSTFKLSSTNLTITETGTLFSRNATFSESSSSKAGGLDIIDGMMTIYRLSSTYSGIEIGKAAGGIVYMDYMANNSSGSGFAGVHIGCQDVVSGVSGETDMPRIKVRNVLGNDATILRSDTNGNGRVLVYDSDGNLGAEITGQVYHGYKAGVEATRVTNNTYGGVMRVSNVNGNQRARVEVHSSYGGQVTLYNSGGTVGMTLLGDGHFRPAPGADLKTLSWVLMNGYYVLAGT